MKDRTGPKKETENTIGKMPVGKLHRCEHMYIYVRVQTHTHTDFSFLRYYSDHILKKNSALRKRLS